MKEEGEENKNSIDGTKKESKKIKQMSGLSKAAALGVAVALVVNAGLSGCNWQDDEDDDDVDFYYSGSAYHGGSYYYSKGASYKHGSSSKSYLSSSHSSGYSYSKSVGS